MIRSLGIAVGVFFVLLLVGVTVVWMSTRTTDILAQSVVDRAARESTTAASDLTAAGGSALDGAALDPLGAPAAAGPSGDDQGARLETVREEVRSDLITWFALAMGGGVLASWVWLIAASRKAPTVMGGQGQRSMAGAWWGCLLLFGVLAVGVAAYLLKAKGLGPLLASSMLVIGFLLTFGFGLIGYYLSTALGAPVLMRPSVLLATTFFPARGRG